MNEQRLRQTQLDLGDGYGQTITGKKVHDFQECLARSHAHSDAPWWEQVYREAFPEFGHATDVRQNGWAQSGGIDRIVTLKTGRVIKIDEKVRDRVWYDILLEVWSDEARRKPGWVQKPLDCEFIAYAFDPNQTCYLMPTLTLQRAWRLHGDAWTDRYGVRRALNKGWVTASVPVPIRVLMPILGDAMKITWSKP